MPRRKVGVIRYSMDSKSGNGGIYGLGGLKEN